MTARGDARALLARLKRAGWRVLRSRRHLVLEGPSGQRHVVAQTPGDRRSARNVAARLRREGR